MQNQRMIYGYARVSSTGQDLAQQLAELGAARTKIYQEKVSGGTAERPQLKRAIGALDAAYSAEASRSRTPSNVAWLRASNIARSQMGSNPLLGWRKMCAPPTTCFLNTSEAPPAML